MKDFDLYEPIGKFLLLIPKTAKSESEGGIFIPEQARSTITMGPVCKKGRDVTTCDIGDEVVYVQHTETPIEVDGRKYLLLDEVNIVLLKRVATNPNNEVNLLMASGYTFEQAARAFYDAEGDVDRALNMLRKRAAEALDPEVA